MFRPVLALLMFALPAFAADRGADKKVWRIDSLIAAQKNGVVTVEARGAVPSGGWKNARLKLVKSDAHGAVFEFVASAPPPGMTVIDAVVPVAASARLRGHVPTVRAAAEANDMTTQVLR